MRLIDADKLYPDRMTNRGTVAISQSQIANAPTVDVLDKIRDEIQEESFEVTERSSGEQIILNYTVNVLRIIDKYRGDKNEADN